MKPFIMVFMCGIAVSLDSFFAGFALSINRKFSLRTPLIISIMTLILCMLACFVGILISTNINGMDKLFNYIGTGTLFVIGVINLFRKSNVNDKDKTTSVVQALCVGLAVGLDAAIANLSLALLGYTDIYIPILFAILHFIAVISAVLLCKIKPIRNFRHSNIISAVILITISIIKLFSIS